jgi:hypothetical protein
MLKVFCQGRRIYIIDSSPQQAPSARMPRNLLRGGAAFKKRYMKIRWKDEED